MLLTMQIGFAAEKNSEKIVKNSGNFHADKV
jgi:hypothetical protein